MNDTPDSIGLTVRRARRAKDRELAATYPDRYRADLALSLQILATTPPWTVETGQLRLKPRDVMPNSINDHSTFTPEP